MLEKTCQQEREKERELRIELEMIRRILRAAESQLEKIGRKKGYSLESPKQCDSEPEGALEES
jgi:hypothetical protein